MARQNTEQLDIIITGAGFAGILMGIKLKEMGRHTFAILEKADRIGGTWRENTYPGAACDIPSMLYSYSFETWPYWERGFSPWNNILEYLEHCVEKYKLNDNLQLGEEVVRVTWVESEKLWKVETKGGQVYLAKVVIGATGPLSRPRLPEIPGREAFAGPSWHTAEWDHSVALKGKKVAVIGTGASAIQVVPSIADEVGELKLFQRTPPWVIFRRDHRISSFRKKVFKSIPFLQKVYRQLIYWQFEMTAVAFVLFPGLMKIAKHLALLNLRSSIKDTDLRKELTPNYMMGCKRVLRSDDYFPSLNRENVHVVTDGILEICPEGVKTEAGKLYELDVIVYATGFEASENMAPFEVKGRGGIDLRDLWQNGGEAYLGTTVANFPNFFIIVGPNTGLGHNSVIHMMESQVHYILEALRSLENQELDWLEVNQGVQEEYNKKVQKRLAGTIWNVGGCMSWYLNQNGKNTTMWPGFTFQFRQMTRRFKTREYIFGKNED